MRLCSFRLRKVFSWQRAGNSIRSRILSRRQVYRSTSRRTSRKTSRHELIHLIAREQEPEQSSSCLINLVVLAQERGQSSTVKRKKRSYQLNTSFKPVRTPSRVLVNHIRRVLKRQSISPIAKSAEKQRLKLSDSCTHVQNPALYLLKNQVCNKENLVNQRWVITMHSESVNWVNEIRILGS